MMADLRSSAERVTLVHFDDDSLPWPYRSGDVGRWSILGILLCSILSALLLCAPLCLPVGHDRNPAPIPPLFCAALGLAAVVPGLIALRIRAPSGSWLIALGALSGYAGILLMIAGVGWGWVVLPLLFVASCASLVGTAIVFLLANQPLGEHLTSETALCIALGIFVPLPLVGPFYAAAALCIFSVLKLIALVFQECCSCSPFRSQRLVLMAALLIALTVLFTSTACMQILVHFPLT